MSVATPTKPLKPLAALNGSDLGKNIVVEKVCTGVDGVRVTLSWLGALEGVADRKVTSPVKPSAHGGAKQETKTFRTLRIGGLSTEEFEISDETDYMVVIVN